ncbi:MAG: MFS transporter, partial [Candidatus Brocadiia bacterium]
MKDYFGLENVGDITTRVTIIYVSYAVANFFSGVFAKRFSLKLILFFGMLLMSIATMLNAFIPADSFNTTVFLILLMGLGGGTYHPAANTLITSCYEGKPGHAIGMLSIGAAAGFIIAPFVGEHIGLEWIGFKNLFLLSGAVGLIFNILFVIFVKDHKPLDTEAVSIPVNNSNPQLQAGKVLIIGIVLMCIPVTIREVIIWSYYEITPFWVKFGFSGGIAIGIVQAMQYMPGIIVQPLTGKLCDKTRALYVVIATFILMGTGTALLSSSSSVVIWIAIILFGIGASSSTVASETYMATITSQKNRSLVYGVCLSVGLGLGGFLAGFSGKVVDLYGKESVTGYRVWFIATGVMLILSTLAYIAIRQLKNKKSDG